LRKIQVLIIDEFSNVTTAKLSHLLWLLPNLVRIVFVGDHNQIRSRKAGDPLGDLRDCFGLIELREILRVKPELVALAEVPKVLSEESMQRLQWNPAGPLTLVEPLGLAKSDKDILKGLLHEVWRLGGFCLMQHQIIVLQNTARCQLNTMCHDLAMEAGIISSREPVVKMGGGAYCVGTKICFTRNYNKPVEWSEAGSSSAAAAAGRGTKGKPRIWRGETVVNGECGVIRAIEPLPQRKGWSLSFVVDDSPGQRPGPAPVVKTIVISGSISNAVSPLDMDLGYAITTTKVQGREYRYAIFWNNRGYSATNGYWSRAHPYVALTRGKERVWCVSTKRDLAAMCANPDPHRRTVLRHMLETHFLSQCRALATKPCTDDLWCPDTTQFQLMPKSVPCVPTLAQVLVERAAKLAAAQKK
jgi:ATP-dependent exoDNAse (exonuclease V) alpha subunit